MTPCLALYYPKQAEFYQEGCLHEHPMEMKNCGSIRAEVVDHYDLKFRNCTANRSDDDFPFENAGSARSKSNHYTAWNEAPLWRGRGHRRP